MPLSGLYCVYVRRNKENTFKKIGLVGRNSLYASYFLFNQVTHYKKLSYNSGCTRY
jgi:hypothetical protein